MMGTLSAITLVLLYAGTATAIPANIPLVNGTQKISKHYTESVTYNCQCNPEQYWMDIIFIVDTSLYTTQRGFQYALDTIRDTMAFANIQRNGYTNNQYFTRAGVISYAEDVSVWATLGSTNKTTFNAALDKINYTASSASNMLHAINEARDQFNDNLHSNFMRRKVMVIFTALLSANDKDSTILNADTFKTQGGIIIVNNYVPIKGVPDYMLSLIASPGQYLDSRITVDPSGHFPQLINSLCQANCFCATTAFTYPATTPQSAPIGGCFMASSSTTNSYPAANTMCKRSGHDGVVSMDPDKETSTFLRTFEQSNGWLGLEYEMLRNRYFWSDGTEYDGIYRPFINYIPPSSTNKNYCVYRIEIMGETNWAQTVCTGGGVMRPFICQHSPCDSARYCSPSDF